MREVYSFGHLEYDRDTLAKEYHRDVKAGLDPDVPRIILTRMMPAQSLAFVRIWMRRPSLVIRSTVYQETPYRLEELEKDISFYGYL